MEEDEEEKEEEEEEEEGWRRTKTTEEEEEEEEEKENWSYNFGMIEIHPSEKWFMAQNPIVVSNSIEDNPHKKTTLDQKTTKYIHTSK